MTREFDPATEDSSAWRRYHRFRRVRHSDEDPDEPVAPDAIAEADLRHQDPMEDVERFVVETGGEVVAELRVEHPRPGSAEYESNRHNAYTGIYVVPAARRRGTGRSLLRLAAERAAGRGARLLTAVAHLESGRAFLEAMGGENRFHELESRLWLDKVDWDLMREWAALPSDGLRLERYEPFPPRELWEAYAAGYTEMEKHVPREGLELGDWILTPERMEADERRLREQGRALYILAAWDGEDLVAVTELERAEHAPQALAQQLTAVHPRARGRGLGKLLKARLLLEMRERFPAVRYVKTENAGSNAAMLGINRRMGFKPHREFFGYQVEVAKLLT